MNATSVYVQLSRLILNLEVEENSLALESIERQLYKLRGLLQCRVCRDLRLDPHCSNFCQHIICGTCLKDRKANNAGCKWCRNLDDLSLDNQCKILILSYKHLCSVLKDFLEDGTGLCAEKRRLQRFILDGTLGMDISLSKNEIKTEFSDSSKVRKVKGEKSNPELLSKCVGTDLELPGCSRCLPKLVLAGQSSDSALLTTNIKTVSGNITAPHSTGVYVARQGQGESFDSVSDAVSSTVPDTYPACLSPPEQDANFRNKYGRDSQNGDESSDGECKSACEQVTRRYVDDDRLSNKLGNIKQMSFSSNLSLSLTEKKHESIFEKLGLALSPPSSKVTPSDGGAGKSPKSRPKKNYAEIDSKRKRSSKTVEFHTTRLTPLRIKMRKISNSISGSDCDAAYSVEAYETNAMKDAVAADCAISKAPVRKVQSRRPKSSTYRQNGVRDRDVLFTARLSSNHSNNPPSRPNLRKRNPQTLIQRLAISSDSDIDYDITDLENSAFPFKRVRKNGSHAKDRETCKCGSGYQMKSLSNICRKQRCPCFRTGRPCINCKCHYCSNPYVKEKVVDSDSEGTIDMGRPPSSVAKDDGPDIDIEVV